MDGLLKDDGVLYLLAVIAAVGASNWAFAEIFDWNVLTDGLALTTGTTEYEVVVALIGVASILLLASMTDSMMEG